MMVFYAVYCDVVCRGGLNLDLCSLCGEVPARTVPTQWRNVFSHIGLVGTQRAETLANQGSKAHLDRVRYFWDRA